VLRDGLIETAVFGQTHQGGAAVASETPFRVGSIAKLLTAWAICQLAEAGQVDLDGPVRLYVPEFTLAVAEAADQITLRHLLIHANGIDGDLYEGFGLGDDCLALWTQSLADRSVNFLPGTVFSYSNSGYSLLGRVIERVTGRLWDEALDQLVLRPLDLPHLKLLNAPHRGEGLAWGHYWTSEAIRIAGPPPVDRFGAPAGSTMFGRSSDLVAFAAAVVDARPSLEPMLSSQIAVPYAGGAAETDQCLGWKHYGWCVERLFGHNGGALGQGAFLRVLPDRKAAIAVMVNTVPVGAYVGDALIRAWVEAETGTAPPPRPRPLGPAKPDTRLAGVYECFGARYVVSNSNEGLAIETTGDLAPGAGAGVAPLSDLGEGRSGTPDGRVFQFLDGPSGRYLYGARAAPKRT
jgi:CubicO group peptidase (beta-lactamase class C family)